MTGGRILAATICAAALAVPGTALADSLVSTGSPPSPFPQNKQNEPTVAIDPINPQIALAGSNDEIDEPACKGTSCPFVPGVGNTGVYWSSNGGGSWTQPSYTGYSGRTGTLATGPIGTLPNYDTVGLVSDGDPAVAWGPAKRGADGKFHWSLGERAYFANLTSNSSGVKKDESIKGYEAIAVSHTVDLQRAMAGNNDGWSKPAVVSDTRQSSSTFSDKEALWADNAESSPFFGNVYVCWTDFRSATATGNGNAPIMISRSTDGGETWSRGIQLTAAHNNASAGGRQGCDMRTDSKGNLYVFFTDSDNHLEAIKETLSRDGGQTFEQPFVVTYETNPGGPSKVRAENDDYDGVAGARSDDFPHVSIANGAPAGAGPDTIALAWADGTDGLNHEHVYAMLSNGGATWTTKTDLQEGSDRGLMPAVALSPNGKDLYVTYDGVLDPFRWSVTGVAPQNARRFQPVVRHADISGTTMSNLQTLFRGGQGDGRASSANALIDEFLGDYNQVSATNDGAVAVYISAQDADQCQAINEFRQSLVDQTDKGTTPLPKPAPGACGNRFGNTDIRGFAAAVPAAGTAGIRH
jgi:hypothetical protein